MWGNLTKQLNAGNTPGALIARLGEVVAPPLSDDEDYSGEEDGESYDEEEYSGEEEYSDEEDDEEMYEYDDQEGGEEAPKSSWRELVSSGVSGVTNAVQTNMEKQDIGGEGEEEDIQNSSFIKELDFDQHVYDKQMEQEIKGSASHFESTTELVVEEEESFNNQSIVQKTDTVNITETPHHIAAFYPPVVICGPSGVGKGTLINKMRNRFDSDLFGFSVSHTTRDPREKEVDGVDYHFTKKEDMQRHIAVGGLFVEYAIVHGNYYGTSIKAIQDVQSMNRIPILDIDIQGVQNVKSSTLQPRCIFIRPPSLSSLEARLRNRSTESEEEMQTRLNNAEEELKFATRDDLFDCVIVNDDLEKAFDELVAALMKWYPHLTLDPNYVSAIDVKKEEESAVIPVEKALSQEEKEKEEEMQQEDPIQSSNVTEAEENNVVVKQHDEIKENEVLPNDSVTTPSITNDEHSNNNEIQAVSKEISAPDDDSAAATVQHQPPPQKPLDDVKHDELSNGDDKAPTVSPPASIEPVQPPAATPATVDNDTPPATSKTQSETPPPPPSSKLLEQELQQTKSTILSLQQQIQNLTTSSSQTQHKLNLSIQKLQNQNQSLQQTVKTQNDQYQSKTTKLQRLYNESLRKQESTHVQAQEMQKQQHLLSQESETKHSRKLDELTRDKKTLGRLLEERESEMDKLKMVMNDMRKKVSSANERASGAEGMLNELGGERTILRDKFGEMERQKALLEEEVDAMKEEVDKMEGLKMELQILREEKHRSLKQLTDENNLVSSTQTRTASERDAAKQQVQNLQRQLSAMTADYQLSQTDCTRFQQAASNLQMTLEAFQSERESEHALLEEHKRDAENAISKAHYASLKAMEETNERKVREIESAANNAVRNVMEEIKSMEQTVENYRQENVNLRRSLDEAIHSLQTTQEDVIDRQLMKNVLLDWHAKKGQGRKEVLKIMSSLLHFTEDEKNKVMLGDISGAGANALGKVVGAIKAPLPPAALNVDKIEGDNVREKWVNFLLAETSEDDVALVVDKGGSQEKSVNDVKPGVVPSVPAVKGADI